MSDPVDNNATRPHRPTVIFVLNLCRKLFNREAVDRVAAAFNLLDGHGQPAAAPVKKAKEEKKERKPRSNIYSTYNLFSTLVTMLLDTSDSFKHSLVGAEGQRGNALRHAGRVWSSLSDEQKSEFDSTYTPLVNALNEESRASGSKCPNLTQRVADFDASLGHPYTERITAAAALLPPAGAAASAPADGEGEAAAPAAANQATPAPVADEAATTNADGAPGSAARAAPVANSVHAAEAGQTHIAMEAEAPAAAGPDAEHKRKRKKKDKALQSADTPEGNRAPAVAAAAAAQPTAVAEAAHAPAADGLEEQVPCETKKQKRKRLKLEAAQRAMDQD